MLINKKKNYSYSVNSSKSQTTTKNNVWDSQSAFSYTYIQGYPLMLRKIKISMVNLVTIS